MEGCRECALTGHPCLAHRLVLPKIHKHLPADVRFWMQAGQGEAADCWLWTGARNENGYGIFRVGGGRVLAHRWVYEWCVGPIGDGRVVRHVCNRPLCCNPHHLQVGTHADNRADCVRQNRHAKGSRNGRAKLDEDKARDIFARVHAGERVTTLAREFGVDAAVIRFIRDGKKWREATGAEVRS